MDVESTSMHAMVSAQDRVRIQDVEINAQVLILAVL